MRPSFSPRPYCLPHTHTTHPPPPYHTPHRVHTTHHEHTPSPGRPTFVPADLPTFTTLPHTARSPGRDPRWWEGPQLFAVLCLADSLDSWVFVRARKNGVCVHKRTRTFHTDAVGALHGFGSHTGCYGIDANVHSTTGSDDRPPDYCRALRYHDTVSWLTRRVLFPTYGAPSLHSHLPRTTDITTTPTFLSYLPPANSACIHRFGVLHRTLLTAVR